MLLLLTVSKYGESKGKIFEWSMVKLLKRAGQSFDPPVTRE